MAAGARGGVWVSVVLGLIWVALVLYALSAYYLFAAAAFGVRAAAIVLFAAPPVLLVSGTVVAAVGRRVVQAWIFGSVFVLLVCMVGGFIVVAHEHAGRDCYEPDGHYCAQAPAVAAVHVR
jgi:hypothetical protein